MVRPQRIVGCCALAATLAGFGAALAVAGDGPDERRIVGGQVANPSEWQFAAALEYRSGDQFCGGSVIAPDAILTAGHCVRGVRPSQMRVVTGRPDLSDESAGQDFGVEGISVHPLFTRKRRHDVAVIRLTDSTLASPVALPSVEDDEAETAPGTRLRVAGWGATRPSGLKASDRLRTTFTNVIRSRSCAKAFRGFEAGEEICTRGDPLGKNHTSACFGDSGGPLVTNSAEASLLMGVVSYGGFRCGVRKPTVYARVADNLAFIRKKAGLRP